MSDERRPRDPKAQVRDPKAEVEEELVDRAMEPWRTALTPEEQAGLRLVLDVFVTTHPAMQSMLERRVREDGGAGEIGGTGEIGGAGELGSTETDAQAVTVPDASGVVVRGDAKDDGADGKAGGAGGKAGGAQ